MSQVAPAKCRVEIFRGPPYFFDDHFLKYTWETQQAVAYKYGDTVLVEIYVGTFGLIIHPFGETINTNPNRYLIVRVTALTGGSWFVQAKLGATVQVSKTFTDLGLKIIDLYTEKGSHFDYDRVTLGVNGAVYDDVTADYYAICKQTLLVPIDTGDVVEQLTITKPVLSQGIGGAKLTLPNFGGALNGEINKFDNIIIWLSRTAVDLGKPDAKVFGGKIIKMTNRANEYGAFFIDLDCHSYAHELNVPPSLLQQSYSAVNGRTIIEDALAVANYITKHPLGPQWFDSGGASGNMDDRINSTHDVEYDEVLPMTVIQEILDKASNPNAVKGFDIYEMPSGVLVGHLRNSLDFTSQNSITPESYNKDDDIHRVRNKFKVYGAAAKPNPSDRKAWNQTVDNWAGINGFGLTVYDDGTNKWIQVNGNGSYTEIGLRRTNIGTLKAKFEAGYKEFALVWFADCNIDRVDQVIFNILCPDTSNYFKLVDTEGRTYSTNSERITIGPKSNLAWTSVGNPSWDNIQGFEIRVILDVAWASGDHFRVTAVHFDKARFSYETANSEAQDSINKYGVRRDEPTVDETLQSDTECETKAKSMLDPVKDPVVSIPDVVIDGDYYNGGDRQRIIVPNDNIDTYLRIIQVQHQVVGPTWDSILRLSFEPEVIDYVFRKLKEAIG